MLPRCGLTAKKRKPTTTSKHIEQNIMTSLLATSLLHFISAPARVTNDLLGLATKMAQRQMIVIQGILRYAMSTWTTFTSSVQKLWESFWGTDVSNTLGMPARSPVMEAPPVDPVLLSPPVIARLARRSPIDVGAAFCNDENDDWVVWSAGSGEDSSDSEDTSDEDTTPPYTVSSSAQADFSFPTE